MKTSEEQKVLFAKFDRDIAKRTRLMRFILAVDQALNVVWLNGSQDETCSSHLARKRANGTITWFQSKVCCFLKKLESNHCTKSLGE